MKVLMTADTVGGVWTYTCELVEALAPLGVDVTIATMGARPTHDQVRAIARLPNAELAATKYALEWMPEPWREVDAAGEWLLALAQRVRPDVVHVNGYTHAALAFGVPVICVTHSCVGTWHRAVRGTPTGPEWTEYRIRAKRGLELATEVVGPTEAILRAVLGEYAVRRTGRVIANGRNPAQWKPGHKEPFVLAAGRLWDEAKGLATLAAAASRVRWPIEVAGPRAMPGTDISVEAHGVHQLGELAPDALAFRMARASIYALPARYEPFGLSVVEAALCGATLLLGDLPSLREIWGDTAVFVPPGDAGALADALDTLIADPLRREALAAQSRTRALALSPARMAGAYREVYAGLATSAREVA